MRCTSGTSRSTRSACASRRCCTRHRFDSCAHPQRFISEAKVSNLRLDNVWVQHVPEYWLYSKHQSFTGSRKKFQTSTICNQTSTASNVCSLCCCTAERATVCASAPSSSQFDVLVVWAAAGRTVQTTLEICRLKFQRIRQHRSEDKVIFILDDRYCLVRA